MYRASWKHRSIKGSFSRSFAISGLQKIIGNLYYKFKILTILKNFLIVNIATVIKLLIYRD